jgi:hypothetical protein
MKILWNLIKNMKPSVMIGFVVLWNLLFMSAERLNGGAGQLKSATPALLMAVACIVLALIGFCSLVSAGARTFVFRPTANLTEARPGLILIGVVGSVLSAALLAVAAFGVGVQGGA